MKKYKLIFEDCAIITINNKNYVIDNGVPFSFNYEKELDIEIDGKKFHLKKDNLLFDFFANFKNKVDGIIGLDIINHFEGLFIDIENKLVSFGFLSQSFKEKLVFDNYCINVKINGIVSKVFMDLVAKDCYCKKAFVTNDVLLKKVTQKTLQGKLDFEVYKANWDILNYSANVDTLIFPKELENVIPFDGFFNPLVSIKKFLAINFKDKSVYFE